MSDRSSLPQESVAQLLAQNPGEPGDLQGTLTHMAQVALAHFRADICAVFAVNPFTNRYFSPVYVGQLRTAHNVASETPRAEGITQYILKQGELFEDDVTTSQFTNSFITVEQVASHAVVGVQISGGRMLAVMYVDFRERRVFTEAEKERYRQFAKDASIGLRQTWLLRRYWEVAEIGQEINAEPDTAEGMFEKLLLRVPRILDISHTFVMAIHKPQRNQLEYYEYFQGKASRTVAAMSGGCQWVMQHKTELKVDYYSQQKDTLEVKIADMPEGNADNPESLVFVPLMIHDQTIGVLSIQSKRPNAFDKEDVQILKLLANQVALTVNNTRLFGELQSLNEAGRTLTEQLDSETVLQRVVELIREKAQTDIAILYPYHFERRTEQPWELPPRASQGLRQPEMNQHVQIRPDDMAALTVNAASPVYGDAGLEFYIKLGGNPKKRKGAFEAREGIVSSAAVPLRVGAEPVGALFLSYRQRQQFGEAQRQTIESLASYAAIAIRNARTYDALSERRETEQNFLRKIDRQISGNDRESEILQTIIDAISELIPAVDRASVLRAINEPNGKALVTTVTAGTDKSFRPGFRVSLNDERGITGWAFRSRKIARVGNVLDDPRYIPVSAGVMSELDVPLMDEANDVCLGVICLQSKQENIFTQQDQSFVGTLAGQAVLAIKNAEGRAASQAPFAVVREIISQLEPQQAYDTILDKALEITKCRSGLMLLHDPKQDNLHIVAGRGVTTENMQQRIPRGTGITWHAMKTVEVLNVNICEPPWRDKFVSLIPNVCWELAVPMLAHGVPIGVINLESPTENPFSPSDEQLVKGLADLAVVAFQNARSYKEASESAKRFELLNSVGQKLGEIKDILEVGQAYAIVAEAAQNQFQSQVVIRRYDPGSKDLVSAHMAMRWDSSPPERLGLSAGAAGQAARERRTVVVPDISLEPANVADPYARDPHVKTIVATPIQIGETLYGTLGLSHEMTHHFQNADIKLIEGLAQQLAITIHRLEMTEAQQEAEKRANSFEAMGSIGQQAYEFAHRLGNDLGLIPKSYITDIREDLTNRGITSGVIVAATERIARDVQQVLELSKTLQEELKEFRADATPIVTAKQQIVPVSPLLDEVWKDLPPVCEQVQRQLEVAADVASIRVAPNQIHDLLRNLITNACQAMSKDGKLILRATNDVRDVKIQVIDSGIGITKENLSRIFDLFFSTKGTSGFGLWSARRNALANGGNLTVESEPGKGSIFTLSLPRADQQQSVAPGRSPSEVQT